MIVTGISYLRARDPFFVCLGYTFKRLVPEQPLQADFFDLPVTIE